MIGNETRYHSPGDISLRSTGAASSTWATRRWRWPGSLPRAIPEAAASASSWTCSASNWSLAAGGRLGACSSPCWSHSLWFAWRRAASARPLLVVTAALAVRRPLLAWIGETAVGVVRPGMFWRAFPLWTHLAVYASAIAAALVAAGERSAAAWKPSGCARPWLVFLLVGAADRARRPQRDHLFSCCRRW